MRVGPIVLGFLLDALLGDPQQWWHPVCAIGNLIARCELFLRRLFPKTPRGERWAGVILWLLVCAPSFFVPLALLWVAGRVHPVLVFALQTIMCYQIFARRALVEESRGVQRYLSQQNLDGARQAVSRIVGRDTAALSHEGVTRAAVETVAENASDGVAAPMLFLFLGGAPLGFFYKAVNTLDSMVGYKTEKYRNFGWFSAKMDDVFNWIPARLCALAMVFTAPLVGLNGAAAFRIWRRDRRKHASPNAAQTEAACAGALGVQLAGNAVYFGQVHQKSTIGDPMRAIEPIDIARAGRLMSAAAVLLLAVGAAIGIWI